MMTITITIIFININKVIIENHPNQKITKTNFN